MTTQDDRKFETTIVPVSYANPQDILDYKTNYVVREAKTNFHTVPLYTKDQVDVITAAAIAHERQLKPVQADDKIEFYNTGGWHHGNGVLVCGTLRIAVESFDTNPDVALKNEVFDYICRTLNQAALNTIPAISNTPSDTEIMFNQMQFGADMVTKYSNACKEVKRLTDLTIACRDSILRIFDNPKPLPKLPDYIRDELYCIKNITGEALITDKKEG